MFEFQGMWLPEGEKHFPEWMKKNGEIVDGRGTYQIQKFRAVMRHVGSWRNAIDVGAHVGFWTIQMAKRFRMVHAFEPIAQFATCWKANVDAKNVKLYECALGEGHGLVKLRVDPADSGGTHVNAVGPDVIDDGTAPCARVMPLDDFDFEQVDFIKVDCEGFEHRVLEGARSTLKRWKPVVIVEQKAHKLGPNFGITGTPAVDLLKELGYRVVHVWGGDYIMVVA